MTIRAEKPADFEAVEAAVRRAFAGENEVRLIQSLRDSADLVASLVAEVDAQIVGHVMVSRMRSPSESVGLAPLAVDPAAQGQGIGTALTMAAIEVATQHANALFVLGDPQYYERFGFRVDLARGFTGKYAGPHLMLLRLADRNVPSDGAVEYAAAFDELA